jgi:hypothetical protein
MSLEEFARERRPLFWDVKDPAKLSPAAILERILNYGDMPDVRELFAIIGIKAAARIFARKIRGKRCNYRPEVKNYFKMYFRKYAK